ncbi:aminopeptidase N [Sphingomonas piscis]|uniref:Aminopeptidase N n=1 Tax=Sphingomonas piscis TaxID=2714943 RepID=A0A6G7YQK8_9SPHN|nr:aminopeptidase N [Sphingomonas piscis]QIK79023.1 aminopeptidase N [Sphingomonas piscis]
MPDVRTNPDQPAAPVHNEIRRLDYRPPDWLVPQIGLRFTLGDEHTRVQTKLLVARNPAGDQSETLRLNGDEITPAGVWIDGEVTDAWRMDGPDLLIDLPGDRHEIGIETKLNPAANTKLMGLYASNGMLCTQCEAEGFRRITFFPDRPDVLSKYRVHMEGDKALFPVLLSNGNRVASGELEGGRHWAEWEDPFPKPCYLFALVAGDLVANNDRFTTMSGREVELNIYVRDGDVPKTGHAMQALKDSMAWDERVYGREYDLDLFNIVAVSDFNMGAMENKGLNIFNTRYILADAETATDADFDNVAGVVAHEYFHNWSGNRVTCRDWFQLSLKEGFTVFRDQGFSADHGSAAVKRIEDVKMLRAAQFPEDQGPLAHPVRPDSYIEISNFYTATIYNKGAELIRMFHTVLGAEKFRAGTDLYFERHDGEAATCDDFVKALEDASGVDLSAFKVWYSQAGTPKVAARLEQDGERATLHLTQAVAPTPGQPVKQPMPIPLKTALLAADGSGEIVGERLILLDKAEDQVRIEGVNEPAILSINRGFSAPILLDVQRGAGELEQLAANDTDPFARYEAIQEMMLRVLIAGAEGKNVDPEPVVQAVRNTLQSNALDAWFKGEAILPPSEGIIGDRMMDVDPDAIHVARDALRETLGRELEQELADAQAGGAAGIDLSPNGKGARRLRSVALGLIAAGDPARGAALAKAQFDAADNMTDRQGAMTTLVSLDAPERAEALQAFYHRFKDDALVLDKWFGLQAAAQRSDGVEQVKALLEHPDFTLQNPNRFRAVVGSFGVNQWVFHRATGEGYRLMADMIITVDALNPQVAARQVPVLGRWKRFEPKRAALMRAELERILAAPKLSKDTFEQVSKSLA